jgi:glycosyltransferase involved in cell wall biosynthesis
VYYETPQELLEFCQQQRIELIHAHSRLAFLSSLQVARRRNIPLVITLHGVYPWQSNYPSTLWYAKKIIAVGPAQAKGVAEHQEKLEIIANGIDIKRFCPSIYRSQMANTLKVLWFGRTHGATSRGVKVLDEAIKILRNRGVNVTAWLIGRPTGATVEQFRVFGWTDNPESILQNGHIAFGHGRALREAMACGNVGFLLGHGYGGQVKKTWFKGDKDIPISAIQEYSLPRPSAERIAADISCYVNNNALLYKDRLEARDIAVKHFDVRQMIGEIANVYRDCIPTGTNSGHFSRGRVR